MRDKRQKSKDIARHAKARAWSRFGLRYQDIEIIVNLIRTNQTTVVDRQSNRISVHAVTYKDEKMNVVYDHTRGMAVTFLYPDMVMSI